VFEEWLRFEFRFEFSDEIQEPRLVFEANGLGFIDAGCTQQPNLRALELFERELNRCAAIAYIRTEAEIDELQKSSGCRPPNSPNFRGTLK
jgi:hypothetical protein